MVTGVISDQLTLSSSHQHFQPSLCWPRVPALKDSRHSTSWGSVGDACELATDDSHPVLPSHVCKGACRLPVHTMELWRLQRSSEDWKINNSFSFSLPTMDISSVLNPMAQARHSMTIFSPGFVCILLLPPLLFGRLRGGVWELFKATETPSSSLTMRTMPTKLEDKQLHQTLL
jgi:hypothetical protein